MSGNAIETWRRLVATLPIAEQAVLDVAPDDATADEGIAYIGRCFAAALDQVLNAEQRIAGGLTFVQHAKGGANPDYRMAQAWLGPEAVYRLSGKLNGAARIAIGLYKPRPGFGLIIDAYVSTDDFPVDEKGRFSITIGGPPTDAAQPHLAPSPGGSILITRELRLLPGDVPAELQLELLQGPANQTPLALKDRLAPAIVQMGPIIEEFLRWTKTLTEQPNRIMPLPDALNDKVQGDPDTHYFSGSFDLEEGEALRIEVAPPECRYWMIQALNYWLEPIPGANFNNATARMENGRATFSVGPSDPRAPNWLNTQGRRRGTLFFRTVGAASTALPTVTLLHLGTT